MLQIPCFLRMKSWLFNQVDKGAEEEGVKGVAGRALRPRLPSLHPARRPPRLHERGLDGTGWELAGLP